MEVNELSYEQKKVYFSIKDFIEKNGYSPSFRELAKINELCIATIHYHLKKLRNNGLIDYKDKRSRTLVIK